MPASSPVVNLPPDPLAALRDYLRANSDIMLLAGGRIKVAKLTKDDVASMPGYAVVLVPSGGRPMAQDYSGLYNQRVDLRTYGGGPKEASDLHRLCQVALLELEHGIHKNTMLYKAEMESGATYAEEPAPLNWSFYLSVWSVTTHFRGVF